MALSTPLIAFQDGAAGASTNLAANASAFVTPGNVLVWSLQSTTGVQFAEFVITVPSQPGVGLDGTRIRWYPGQTNSFAVSLPLAPVSFILTSEVNDGNNVTTNSNTFFCYQSGRVAGQSHNARAVQTSNVANLASATVTVDGVTLVQGDYVLLVNQTTGAQNGLYVVGVVGGGNAPLTRPPDYATGQVFDKSHPQTVEIGPEGTAWANSTWKCTTTGPITVDTTTHAFFPRVQRGTGATGGGTTVAISTLWALASTSTMNANDVTGAAAVACGAIVAGSGNGTCTLTGTTAHTLSWMLTNW
jgi:hypothetical protein